MGTPCVTACRAQIPITAMTSTKPIVAASVTATSDSVQSQRAECANRSRDVGDHDGDHAGQCLDQVKD